MTTSPTEPIRTFIAVRPNQSVYTELIRVQRELKTAFASSGLRIKWTDPETFHITLLFLGEIPAVEAHCVFQALELTASGHRRFSSYLREVGLFKKSGALWAGIDVPPELLKLQKALADELKMEPGRFHAHFTLGRLKKGRFDPHFFQTLEKTDIQPVPFSVNELELVASELLPDGARHTVFGTSSLSCR
jgi:2'-5' RNA ligase